MGEHIHLACRVLDAEGAPIPDAMIEIWQADAAGIYKHPDDPRHNSSDPALTGFGRLPTNKDGVSNLKPSSRAGFQVRMALCKRLT